MDTSTLLSRLLPVFVALAIATLVEALIPLKRQSLRRNGRLVTNVWLLFITIALGMLLNFTLALGAAYAREHGIGLLQALEVNAILSFVLTLLALDAASYAVHRLMHRWPLLWRVHLVHHIDASVDATTAFRQHPVEGVLRFSFIAGTAWFLGAPPAAIALYRLLGSLNSVLEHSNIRVPGCLDRGFVWFWVTPDMHKVHHSRVRKETDSNYANLFSFFDHAFGTFTPSERGPLVEYGISGYDSAKYQSIWAVLCLPFRRDLPMSRSVATGLHSFVTRAGRMTAAGDGHDRRGKA
jgi:sterol desaturase/sphingolipid hydroxylase (fatty acid hydroxylase superfamily)